MIQIPDLKSRLERIKKFQKYLPWGSLAIGIVSGLSMAKDFDHVAHFSIYFSGAVVILFLAGIVFKPSATASAHKYTEFVVLLLAQSCVQYLIFYSIPLLYFSSSWFCLLLTLGFATVSLWDPWWESLTKLVLFRRLLRAWTTLLGVSFLWGVFFNGALNFYYFFLCVVCFAVCYPYGQIRLVHFRDKALNLLPMALALIFCVWQFTSDSEDKMPLLSVWVEDAEIGFTTGGRKVAEPLPRGFDRENFALQIQNGKQVCCQTPIVAPLGLRSPVTHVWKVNGAVVDTIELPSISGNASREHAYRTHSCKANFGDVAQLESLSCAAYLGNHIFVGKISKSASF